MRVTAGLIDKNTGLGGGIFSMSDSVKDSIFITSVYIKLINRG
jgi:hypothetical protein